MTPETTESRAMNDRRRLWHVREITPAESLISPVHWLIRSRHREENTRRQPPPTSSGLLVVVLRPGAEVLCSG